MVQEEGSSSVTSASLQFVTPMSLSPKINPLPPWLTELKPEERGLCLIHLLISCANFVASCNLENANIALDHISHFASPDGDTMQRIAAYFTEAFANRMIRRWPGLYRALNSTKITPVSEKILTQRLFVELCPFLRLLYVIVNQAIVDAMAGEKMVHVVDLNCLEPAQWISLMHMINVRPDGPPHLRITGIHENKEVLEEVAARLTEVSEKLDIPFQFNPIVSKLENLDLENLRVKTGEALAVSSVLQLHTLLAPRNINSGNLRRDQAFVQRPDSESGGLPKIGDFLSALWSLSPKLMVIAEQEAHHNGPNFMERVMEALNFYAALFDCLESTVSRASMERLKIEKLLFGEEIKNILVSEGFERKERHEKLEKWVMRLELAGFGKVALSYHNVVQAMRLLQSYGCNGYKLKEENDCLFICWHDRPLFSVSSWRFRRFD